MNVIPMLREQFSKLRYASNAIVNGHVFSDVASATPNRRRVDLAAFTQTPPSYRTAAFGAAVLDHEEPERFVRGYRDLGAPLFFVAESDSVSVWQVYADGPPRLVERASIDGLDRMFEARKTVWAPEAIYRAKSIGRFNPAYQLDFVDVGLMPAIESEIYKKLDRLLSEALVATRHVRSKQNDKALFQGVFRLMAAKILTDRTHRAASTWNADSVESVLDGIGVYYGLSDTLAVNRISSQLAPAWSILRSGLNVSNISADDLAFVYENTLVTPETRRAYGTHSTPRHVAEYIVGRLDLWRNAEHPPAIYEPFAGAGVFLVSALRHLREGLPHNWTDRQRHDLLVKKIKGSEIDAFACEVAVLSLILADYPNKNGWKIENIDLFQDGNLAQRLAKTDVVLCNPPFEIFNNAERRKYPDISALSGARAEAVLTLALKAAPKALGFVLPRSFLLDRAYRDHRREIERLYREVEFVSLPDGVFRVSQVESALLIARDHRSEGTHQIVRSSEVDDADRATFAFTGAVSRTRAEVRSVPNQEGQLWIPPLGPLWRSLEGLPKLGDFVDGHWGIRWLDGRQSSAASDKPGPKRALGFLRATGIRQFSHGRARWLDVDPSHLYGAGELPWEKPKILCNAARLSRGYWRVAAATDREGLRASQQFVGLWPKSDRVDLDAIAAVLNGPVANAYMADHSTEKRFRITTLLDIPVPFNLPAELGDLTRQYSELLVQNTLFKGSERLGSLLDKIDEIVLEAYDLTPRLTRSLLGCFTGSQRPLEHDWRPWNVLPTDPALSLAELRSGLLERAQGAWPKQRLKPVPQQEFARAAPYLY